jgi:hypothetical protein
LTRLLPTAQRSDFEGGFRIEGPGPEKPPPIAIITMLTMMPPNARIADDRKMAFFWFMLVFDDYQLIL